MGSSCCKPNKATESISKLSFASTPEIATPSATKINDGEFKSWVKYTPTNFDEDSEENFCRKIPIIHPFGPFRLIWDAIVIVILIYTSIEVPYTLTFGIILSLSDINGIVALLVDIFLLIDIVFNFQTGYVDKYDSLHIIASPKLIAKRYIKSWFLIDLISSLPFEFVVPLFLSNDSSDRSLPEFVKILRIFRLLRGIKMLRVLRIFKLFKGFGRHFFLRETAMVLKCIRCLAAMLITAHYFACFWYLVGWYTQKNGKESWLSQIEVENPSNFTKYSYSWYWAIVTLFTTGYGDIVAHNEEEQWTASVCILIGTCFFAYFIGVLTTLLEEGDRLRMYEIERVQEAQLFCSHHRIPKQLARVIISHIRYYCNYNYVFDHERIMASIPTHLQNHVNAHLAQSLIELDIFKHLPSSVVGQIALKMRSKSCNSGHTLFKKGDLSKEFFIQRTGRSKLFTKLKNGKTRVLERGDVCGEYAILSGKHRDTVKCLTWSEFYVLDINDLLSILRDNYLDPKAFDNAYKSIKTVLRTTLQKATKRKVKFRKRTIEDEDTDFIHELSPESTRSLINPVHRNKPQLIPTSDPDAPPSPNGSQPIQTGNSLSSRKLIHRLSGFLQRETSAGRHEAVLIKPNALSLNMAALNTEHRPFEYSDHEDSHYYSDSNNKTLSKNIFTTRYDTHSQRGHHNNNNDKMSKVKTRSGKFGANRKRMMHQKTHRKANVFGMKVGAQTINVLRQIKDSEDNGNDNDIDYNKEEEVDNKYENEVVVDQENKNINEDNKNVTDNNKNNKTDDIVSDSDYALDEDDEYDIEEKSDAPFGDIDTGQSHKDITVIELSENSNQHLKSRSFTKKSDNDAGSDSFIYSTRDTKMLAETNTNI